MVRPASRRKEKYEAKIDADVMRSRILAHKSSMVEQMEVATADLATLEAEVKRVVEGYVSPVASMMIPFYLNVGRELYKKSKKFSGNTFTAEAKVCCDKWFARGLYKPVIILIAALFGYTYT